MHHGVVQVPVLVEDALREAVSWTAGRSSKEDFVIVYINKCRGTGCWEAVEAVIRKLQLPMISDCRKFRHLRLEEAMQLSRLPNRGHMLVIQVTIERRRRRRDVRRLQFEPSVDFSVFFLFPFSFFFY